MIARGARKRHTFVALAALAASWIAAWVVGASASALSPVNDTPFPRSTVIPGAVWSSRRHGPPRNQWGDILSTSWADDGNLYTLINDGGTDSPRPGALWRNSFAQIVGAPLNRLRFRRVGISPSPATWNEIHRNPALWSGPLGSFYASGFVSVNHTFYATQQDDWQWGANGPFTGLAGIAYSTDEGQHWQFPSKPFPAPLGNLNWVQRGRDVTAPDGYVYAIATEREFNADSLILGRAQPDVADLTDPANWQWASGWTVDRGAPWPAWSSSLAAARPILSWPGHITYPRMSFDPGLRRYLLTFTFSYGSAPPAIWQNGSELEILEGPHPWGPFAFVARNTYFGPSNGYDPAVPVKWISPGGRDAWLIWAANFDGCAGGLRCAAAYGFNYQRIYLLPPPRNGRASAARAGGPAHRRAIRAGVRAPAPPAAWRELPATPPPFAVPRLLESPLTR